MSLKKTKKQTKASRTKILVFYLDGCGLARGSTARCGELACALITHSKYICLTSIYMESDSLPYKTISAII